MPVVDVHTHVFPPEVRRRRETFCQMDPYFAELYEDPRAKIATVEDLLTEMDAAGVDISVMCGFGWSSPDLCAMHNDYMLDCIRNYPYQLAALATVQPLQAERALAEVERCLAGGMKGVGELMPDGQGYILNEAERLRPFFSAAEQMGVLVMTHATEPVGRYYPGKESVTPDVLWDLVESYPDLKLILAHWGGGYPFYELMPEVRGASQNVYYDSAASTYLYSPQVFSQIGQMVGFHKVLWATDYPVLTQRRFLQRVRQMPLSEADREAVLGGNAAKLLRLNGYRKSPHDDAVHSWAF